MCPLFSKNFHSQYGKKNYAIFFFSIPSFQLAISGLILLLVATDMDA
jgi:hypothetical protein